MRLIDADSLEKEGWSLHRTYQKDKTTMVYEVKAISEINTAQSEAKTNTNGDWVILNKDKILKAGMEGREVDFRIGGRLFAIREKAQ